MMRIWRHCIFNLIAFGSSLVCAAPSVERIDVFIRDDVYEDYLKFVNGRQVTNIDDFSGKTMRRDVADMVLLQQPLALGGFHKAFRYQPGKVNFRNTKLLESGQLLFSFDTYWSADAAALGANVLVSEPVILRGEYLAGLYASPNNTAMFSVKSLADLANFTAVSTPKWRTDWQTMSALPLKKLVREDEWLSQARMVSIGWVDFMLMPFFHNSQGLYQLETIRLKVVPGVAVLLDDSRHFVVSAKHPDGPTAFAALNRGLAIMRKDGRITKMYQQAGFFPLPGAVKILNAEKVTKTSK